MRTRCKALLINLIFPDHIINWISNCAIMPQIIINGRIKIGNITPMDVCYYLLPHYLMVKVVLECRILYNQSRSAAILKSVPLPALVLPTLKIKDWPWQPLCVGVNIAVTTLKLAWSGSTTETPITPLLGIVQ